MAYRADEVAARAELLRDLRSDDTGEMLAYCARVLAALEDRSIAETHGIRAPMLATIQEALDRHHGVQAAAAREFGITPRSVRYYSRAYGLSTRPRPKE